MWCRRHGVRVVMLLVALAPVRSQSSTSAGDLPTKLPIVLPGASLRPEAAATLFVNGPTGISVEAEHHRAAGVRDFVNGPTGTSVDAEEDRPPSGVIIVNGPMGTSVAEQELRSEEAAATVEGPTAVQDKPKTDEGRSVGRGVISTDPKDNPGIKQLPPGLHIDTTDWSRDSGLWSYQGGDWALVDLPDAQHPTIPQPDLPGKALVVVTPGALKKVRMKRVFRGLYDVTLHYRFFLSQGHAPHVGPELKVYQVAENMSSLLRSETSRGAWSDTTIKLPHSGAFTIVFEGRLMQGGNEIAVDDITISGNSLGGQEISRTKSQPDDTSSQAPDTLTQTPDASHTMHLYNEENMPSEQTTGSVEGITGNDTTQHENSTISEAISPSTDTENVTEEVSENTNTTQGIVNIDTPVVTNINGTQVIEEFNKGSTSSGDWEAETIELQGPEKLNDSSSGDWVVETVELVDISKINNNSSDDLVTGTIELPGQDINVGVESGVENENITADSLHTRGNLTIDGEAQNKNGSDILDNDPTDKVDFTKNETEEFSITTGRNKTTEERGTMVSSSTTQTIQTGEANQTQIAPEMTNVNNNSGEPTHDNTNSSPTPSQPLTSNTGNTTLTITFKTPDNTNYTFIPSESQQPGGETSPGPSSTSLGVTTTSGVSQPMNTMKEESTNTSTSLTYPSGFVTSNTTTNAIGTNTPVVMPADSTVNSWRVFQVFLVLCTLGLLGLGFLYWRKKRRQDDEIPMFTRQPHTDYHNPTFSIDDAAFFMSRGSRHNYKSFD